MVICGCFQVMKMEVEGGASNGGWSTEGMRYSWEVFELERLKVWL